MKFWSVNRVLGNPTPIPGGGGGGAPDTANTFTFLIFKKALYEEKTSGLSLVSVYFDSAELLRK